MAWWRVIVGLLLFWLVTLIYMRSTLYPSKEERTARSGTSMESDRRLVQALHELDELKRMNEKLYLLARRLQFETKSNGGKVPAIEDAGGNIPDEEKQSEDEVGSVLLSYETSQSQAIVERDVSNGVQEQWRYISAQLKKLKLDVASNVPAVDQIDEILATGMDYRRAIMRDLHNLTSLSVEWKEREHRELSELVQARISYVQNPTDCSTARKLVCNINKGCGYGCQLHHVIYCFLVAHGTGRTLILESRGWRYSSGGWEKYFQPVSDTCTDRRGASQKPWGPNVDSVQVVELPIIDSMMPRSEFMPQAIPTDLAARLIRLHGHPFVWWVGQFFKYLLRPQAGLAGDMEEVRQSLGHQSPIVGVHVRRTDKVNSEAAFHGLHEYMLHVEEYFNQVDLERARSNQPHVQRRIYLATDDPNVLSEARISYPQYEVISDTKFSRSASLSSRYSDQSLRAIILDIHLLSLSDYLVCTFSSQVCRVAYEIMQSMHPDASDRFTSLDDIYYFGGQMGHIQVAVTAHEARNDREINLKVGDSIKVAGNHWNGFSKGHNERTGQSGVYPSYKVRERIDVVVYPTYPEAAKRRDKKSR